MSKVMDGLPANGVRPGMPCTLYAEGEWREAPATLPCEASLAVRVNGQELVSILCTPAKLEYLVLGFLYSEGIIDDVRAVTGLRLSDDGTLAEVQLADSGYKVPSRRTRTPSGVSVDLQGQRVNSDLAVRPQEVLALMKELRQHQELFRQCGGMHCSALCDRGRILVVSEDIGRHNTLDKVLGECLAKGIPTRGLVLLTTGRISSEMVLKAARMQAPVVVSRGAPTERAVSLGEELGIAVIGYTRGRRLSAFSRQERLLPGAGKVETISLR